MFCCTLEATGRFRRGAYANTLHVINLALALAHSTAEYWRCRSAHTRLIDSTINDALLIITECLRPTPTDNLPVFAGIQPAGFCRQGATYM